MKKDSFILFAVIALIIYSVSIWLYYQKSAENATQQALYATEDFLRNVQASNTYFQNDQKKKLLHYQEKGLLDKELFLPELYSCTYAAIKINEYYNAIRKQENLQPIKLHFISDNPRNKTNIATSEEVELLEKFRNGTLTSFYKIYTDEFGKQILYYAKAGKRAQQECLSCHGEPSDAPKVLIKEYGKAHGFGTKIGDMRAFSQVSMPLEGFIEKEKELFQTRALASLFSLLALFILTYIFLQKEHKDSRKFQHVIDTLNELVIIKTDKKIISINRAFLKFFGVKDIKDFQKKYSCISNEFILKDSDLKLDMNLLDDKMIDALNAIDKTKRIITMYNAKGEEKNLTIKIHKLGLDEFVIVLSDITKIKNHADMLEKKANTDALTQITSRQKFDELYRLELHRSQRYINALSIIFLDIDHFKHINDRFGHDIGDKTLVTFAQVIQKNIREYDVFARWGGEEFILMLPQTDMTAAFKIAEKLRDKISKHNFGIIGTITCSIGISMLKKDDDEKSLIKRADNALYKAKNSGRNRTIIDF